MIAGRRSHSTLSKGDTFPSVKRRWKSRPEARRVTFSVSDWLCRVILASISPPAPAVKPSYVGWTAVGGDSILLLPRNRIQGVVVCIGGYTKHGGKVSLRSTNLSNFVFRAEKIEKPS